ncbi:MAG: serine/threonine protein kinase [Myxococcales bacterium]|nr:serine/threonine protein kinase [Myxococcales bacterium]
MSNGGRSLGGSGRRGEGLAIAATWNAGGGEQSPKILASIDEVPTRIGRFTVLYTLGAGAMGVVYAAYDAELDRKVAIKLVHGDAGEGYEDRQRRLLREAQALARLSHPNVVSVHEVGIHRNQVYVAMEFVEGQTLREWLRGAEPRAWEEIIRVFTDAGRGLAAAHGAGLVHRDFKPENVLVGADGRPRVLDFGLVRPSEPATTKSGPKRPAPSPAPAPSLPPEARGSNAVTLAPSPVVSLDESRPGEIVGTPAYMSPEQWRAGHIDARTDQFSFCAALYEALYERLPFPGSSAHQVAEAVKRGALQTPPTTTRVPYWVYRVLARGLSTDPETRWPSMPSLLAALAADPLRRRRRIMAGTVGALALCALGYGAATLGEAPARTCARVADELAGVWDRPRREAARSALVGSGVAYGDELWTRVEARIDRYAEDWVALRGEACLAHRQGRESDSLFDRRVACLDERRRSLAAAVDVLEGATPEIAASAVDLVAALPPLGRCADGSALAATIPAPDDPALAETVASIELSLTRAAARENAGQYWDALAITGPLVAEVDHLPYRPIVARTLVRQGSLEMETGRLPAAESALYEAIWIALEVGDEDTSLEAIAKWLFVVGAAEARPDDALALERLALVLAERASPTSRLPALVLNNLGAVAHRRGDLAGARSFYRRALALSERSPEANPLEIAATLNNLGLSHADEGDAASALPYLRRALEIYASVAGDHHPYLAATLTNAGDAELRSGAVDRAREHHSRALEIFRETLGPTHPNLAYPHFGLARAAIASSDREVAQTHLEAAIEGFEASTPPPSELAEALEALADLRRDAGDRQAAVALSRRAIEVHATLAPLGDEHLRLVVKLADHLLDVDAADEARRLLADLLARPESTALDPVRRAPIDFALARALVGVDSGRARALASAARSSYGASREHASAAAAIDRWLAELTPPEPTAPAGRQPRKEEDRP